MNPKKKAKLLQKQAFMRRLEEAYFPTPHGKVSKIKEEALLQYGLTCVDCGNGDPASLELDHVETTGKTHRRSISGGKAGADFYRGLKKRGWPNHEPFKLETVCGRCHNLRTAQRRIR